MKTLICPVSIERIEENTVRITGLLVALSLVLVIAFPILPLLIVIIIDYFIRAFTNRPSGPISWIAKQIARKINFAPKYIDKAPKIFAARVGFLFALTGFLIALHFPLPGTIIMLILCAFALLESVGNICMGCLIYTHIVLRIYK